MKAKKLLSLVICVLMIFSTASLMAYAESEVTIYEVKNATEFNNAIAISGKNSAIRLIADITTDQTFAVIKNKDVFAIDLNGYSITGTGDPIGDFITVGNDTSLMILNNGKTRSDIIVNSAAPGTSALCVNGKNASLRILNNISVVMGTNGNYGIGSNYAHCIKVVDGSALSINGADIYNWMYWGRGISFCNYAANAFDNFAFSVSGDSEITAKVACIDFSFTNSLPGTSVIKDCNLSYEPSLPYFDDGSSAPKKDFMAIKAVDDDFKLIDALAEGYIAEYVRMDVLVDNDSLIKDFPKGEDILINTCDSHSWINANCKKAKHCEYCGKTEGEPAPHTYYVVTDSSTCTAPGVKVSKCSVCGHQPTENVPARGHNNVMLINQAPSYNADGYKEYECVRCKLVTKETISNKPTGVTAIQNTSAIRLTWNAVPGAAGYRVYQKVGEGWKSLGTVTNTTATLTKLNAGTKYTYAIRAGWIKDGAVQWATGYTTINTATQAAKPAKVAAAQNETAIRLAWTACPGATGYRIFYKVGDTWKISVNATTATSYMYENLKPGAKYTLAVRPYILVDGVVIWSDYVEFITATKPAAPVAKASSPSKGKITLTYNAVNGADGYQVYYSENGGAYKLYKVYTAAGTLNFANLKSGTKYTFAVRAGIRTSGGNIFGGFNPVTVTVK